MTQTRIRRVTVAFSVMLCLLASACSSKATEACRRISKLCDLDLSSQDIKDCVESIDEVSQLTKTNVGKKLFVCTDDAASCAEAVGCAAGVGVTVFSDVEDQFKKGFERGAATERRTKRFKRSESTTESHGYESRREETRREETRREGTSEVSDDRPAVRYLSVAARPGRNTFGHNLLLSIELESETDMPNVAPHVNVNAICGSASDTQQAFFTELSNARQGDRRFETVTLFSTGMTDPPDECEITLTLTRGSTPPRRYCFQSGRISSGRCP